MSGPVVVVLAEDEWLIRAAAAAALREEGFEVIEAEHADEALNMLQVHGSHIHLLFTDIGMPGAMDGLALAHQTARRWPWVAILIASAHVRPARDVLPPKARFVAKPYDHGHVVSRIRELTAA